MKTSLVPTGGAGGQRAARLRQASDTMEMGLSNLGTDERKTRTGYKDQMKKKAFDLIAHAASNLNLHDSVVGRAQELFANFRDEREFVQKFDAVVRDAASVFNLGRSRRRRLHETAVASMASSRSHERLRVLHRWRRASSRRPRSLLEMRSAPRTRTKRRCCPSPR